MARPLSPRSKCPTPGCSEMVPQGSLCNACRVWWYRVRAFSGSGLARYLTKLDRLSGRARRLTADLLDERYEPREPGRTRLRRIA